MERVKCRECGAILEKHEMMYQVRIVEVDGRELYTPCCSEKCALVTQNRYTEIHQKRMESVQRQIFQCMTVENYCRG